MSDIHFEDSSYSLKQARIWSDEYASLSGSSENLKEWQCRIIEKNALTKKVLHMILLGSLFLAYKDII